MDAMDIAADLIRSAADVLDADGRPDVAHHVRELAAGIGEPGARIIVALPA